MEETMHRNALILTVLVTLLCGCASSRRQVAAPPDTGAIGLLLDEWTAAWSSNDVNRLTRLFTEDVYYEDATLGAVSRGRPAMAGFATSVFVGFFFFQAEDGIRDLTVTGVQTCALPI